MDPQRLSALSRLPSTEGGRRRIQWKIYVEPNGPARRLLRDPSRSHTLHLPQFFSTRRTMAILWDQARSLMTNDKLRMTNGKKDHLPFVMGPGVSHHSSFKEDVLAGLRAS